MVCLLTDYCDESTILWTLHKNLIKILLEFTKLYLYLYYITLHYNVNLYIKLETKESNTFLSDLFSLCLRNVRPFVYRDSRSGYYLFPFPTILCRIDNWSASPKFPQIKSVTVIEAAGRRVENKRSSSILFWPPLRSCWNARMRRKKARLPRVRFTLRASSTG